MHNRNTRRSGRVSLGPSSSKCRRVLPANGVKIVNPDCNNQSEMTPEISSFISIYFYAIAFSNVDGAKILGLFPDISKSHSTQNRPLFLALAARGHHVTVLSAYPEKNPVRNYRDIFIEGITEHTDKHIDFQGLATQNIITTLYTSFQYGTFFNAVNRKAFLSNGTQSLIKSNENFDLIFIDFTSTFYNLGFVHKFGNPPFIGVVPFGSNIFAETLAGNPSNPAFVPSISLPLSNQMSFFERLVNTVGSFVLQVYLHYTHYRNTDVLMRLSFGEKVPNSLDIAKNVSLLMVNTDIAHDYPRALSPMTIEIGGLHLKPAIKLPQDIKQFIDESTNGIIFFSLGSLVRSDEITADKLNAILETFRALPQRVLWKWESDRLPNLPPNVMVRKWLPQNDILGDSRVRLFITHGGISSLEEAVYHRVPMVVIPIFGDQFFQARKIEHHGIGKKVDYLTLTEEGLLTAVQSVLQNSSYRKNMKRISRISQDKINTPLQTAIFWTEYVLRNGASQHLRPAGAFFSWPRFFLLDVVLAISFTALLMALPVVLLLKKLGVKQKAETKRRLFGTQRPT